MDVNQRFLRRIFLLDNLDLLLRESYYHRNHDDDEELVPVFHLWNWDESEGVVRLEDDSS